MAVDHIQETDTLNAGRGKINQAIDLANSSSTKVDQYRTELDQGVADAKTIATNAGNEAKNVAQTAAVEATQTASSAATEATSIATAAGNEAKEIAETAGAEANVKADQAIADSRTAVDNSNQAIGRANQNKQEFDALENEFNELIAQSGDSTPEIVQARTDSQGVKQDTLQNRLAADFGIRLTNADAIQLFSGPVNVPKMMDFSGKVAGNIAANPHVAYTDYTATSLKKPAATWTEVSQDNYNKLVGRDDQGVSVGSSQGSVIPQQLSKFDTVKAIEQLAPRIFEGLDLAGKVKYIKDNFISFSVTTRAKASSPNNKNLKVGVFVESTDEYTTKIQGDATEFTDFTTEINDSNFIDSKGFINVLSYTDSSNGVTAANLNTDYIGVQLMISLNPLTVLNKAGFANEADLAVKADQEALDTHASDETNPHNVTADQVGAYSKTAADSEFLSKLTANDEFAKKVDITKENVGLNNVQNYGVATQSEAEVGLAENKFVTPLGVKQHTDKRIATASDVLIGTNKTQLLTPYSTKLFYDSQEKNRSKFLSVRTKYAAHRGNNSVFPENSLEAFKSVTRHEFFECDVQVTKDDEWIVMHDTTVDRTTNGTGNVKDLTYAQIRALKIDAGSNINNLQDWQKIVPDLSEVCQCARYGKSIPMIEIKGGAGEVYSDAQLDKFMDTLHQFRMLPDGAIVISFDADILARIRQRSNEIELMWIQNSIPLNGLDICKANRFGIDVAYNSVTLTKENITAFHKAGLLVGTWTTPEANHQQQEGLGVDIITTDSKSGFLRYGSLTLKNGFTGNTNNGLQNYNVVEEISPGQVRAYFNVLNGVNTSDSIVATFPDWAVPFTNSWQFCNIRTSSGSILATANVMGKTSGNAGISIGLNWTQRTTWAAGVLHWSLY